MRFPGGEKRTRGEASFLSLSSPIRYQKEWLKIERRQINILGRSLPSMPDSHPKKQVQVFPAYAPGPLVVSEANPRYFTVGSPIEGKAAYLTGSHIWNNFH